MSNIVLADKGLPPAIEIGAKAVGATALMIGAYKAGDKLGIGIFNFRNCHLTLANIMPTFISKGIPFVYRTIFGSINDYFDRHSPLIGRVVAAPIIEELAFRGLQLFVFSKFMGLFSRILLSSLLFTYSHDRGQPGVLFGLLFVGIILGCLSEWNESRMNGLLTAIVAHSIYNSIIDRFHLRII